MSWEKVQPSKADRLVYCRKCRRRHRVQAERFRQYDGIYTMRYTVRCPKERFWLRIPMRHEKTLRWMPL